MKRRLVTVLVVLALMVCILPMAVFADEECTHSSYKNGVCEGCGAPCTHSAGWYAGKCNTCKIDCTHSSGWNPDKSDKKPGKCKTCGLNCTHEGTNKTVVVTNCNSTNGKYGYTICECGYKTQGKLGDAVAHSFASGNNKCDNCNQTHTHNFGTGGSCSQATCTATHTEHNLVNGVCTMEGCSYGCTHQNAVQNAFTCGEGGNISKHCGECGMTIATDTPVPAGHSYSDVAYACGQEGYITQQCANCKKYNPTTTPIPTTHVYDNDGRCTNPNCNAVKPEPCEKHSWYDPDSDKAGICSVCSESCGHANGTTQTYGDCLESNYDHKYCKECKKLLEYIPHDRISHTPDTNNVCTVCGAAVQICEKHDWEWSTGICKACGTGCPHEKMNILRPNCEEGGYINHKCTVCGWIMVENTPTEPGAHKYKITSTATCTDAGIETALCEVCGYSVETQVPALGHDYKNGVCTRCGHSTVSVTEPVTNTQKTVANSGEYDDVPKTGDVRIVPVAVVVLLFGTAVCVFGKKRIA